jgi:hypothetical protein
MCDEKISKRRNVKNEKIGLLALALVLALGTLGAAYAHWVDAVYIYGEVCTGSVDLKVVDTSNTWIWKMENHGIFLEKSWDAFLAETITPPPNGVPTLPAGGVMLVAWADADQVDDDTVAVNIGNAFPGCDLTADMLVHYVGSVPAMVTATLTNFEGEGCDLLAPYVEVHFYESDEFGYMGAEIVDCPVQMHYCDYVLAVMTLNIPQDPPAGSDLTQEDFMNKCCWFNAEITATQWNECID